ncbi:MAG: DUF1365 domain-containing protein [Pseudomonadota bacterium]
MNSALYTGWVRHRRFAPVLHRFRYRALALAIDLDDLPTLDRWPVLTVDRFGLMSIRQSDYLDGELTRDRVWDAVETLGGRRDGGRVVFLGLPRSLGYYFSPVNFFYCHGPDGELSSILVEVSNTPWGERHRYLVDYRDLAPTPKAFHVSPFMDMDQLYRWRFTELRKRLCVHIENHADDKLFDATLVLDRKPLTGWRCALALIRSPAVCVQVLVAIYWQAMHLYRKGVKYVPHPR